VSVEDATLTDPRELDDWATVTLYYVAQHATLMDDERFSLHVRRDRLRPSGA
jgi:hypothetical protein